MTALKLLGILVILLAGGASAFGSARYERRRLRVLDGWLDMILYIRAQVDCYLTPIDEILSDFVPENAPADLASLYASSRPYLDTETRHLLEGFIRAFGNGYREEQLRHCDYCIAALRGRREGVAAELPARVRLAVTVCACLSVGTAILLW